MRKNEDDDDKNAALHFFSVARERRRNWPSFKELAPSSKIWERGEKNGTWDFTGIQGVR